MSEPTPLQILLDTLPQCGRVEWIDIRPARGEPMQALNSVGITPGKGLEGDRFKGRETSKRQVTLIQQDDYSIDLLSYNELTQQHISRAQSRRTALALSAMAQSFSAAQPQTTTTYGSGTAYGSGGTTSYYGIAQSYTHDPVASAAAQAQIQGNVQAGVSNIQSDLQQNLNSMDGYLQKTTVFPGQTYSGRFQSQMTRFDQRPESIYALTVELGNERFSFEFVEEADIQTHQRKLF